ncbi:dATP/dGTP diphosphohydrolase domain-containing protein [Pseudarthrobacter sp. S9]|uniref:dATP/dGTP diphosphohydrolase domain-containing protein n=1 Tax=Pseudarthrobacter sp. S9 TaxID=3418421 RepID=UPI003CFF6A9C
MKIYIAGPMRGLPQFNFPAFDQAASVLESLGHEVFNPADRDRSVGFTTKGMTGNENLAEHGFSLREALHADTRWISLHADAIAVLPGWEKSTGAKVEVALGRALGIPVAYWKNFSQSGPIIEIPSDLKPSGALPGTIIREAVARTEDALKRMSFAASGAVVTTTRYTNSANEVRTTSSTGGEKGTKPERYDLIPVGALATVAALYGQGAAKYAAHNWRRGYEWSKSYAALQRHATQFWNGEDNDAEMGLPHMASVAFHALALLTFMEERPGFDDRFKVEGGSND